jgi:hypothetical protein
VYAERLLPGTVLPAPGYPAPACYARLGLLDEAAQSYCEALQRRWSS